MSHASAAPTLNLSGIEVDLATPTATFSISARCSQEAARGCSLISFIYFLSVAKSLLLQVTFQSESERLEQPPNIFAGEVNVRKKGYMKGPVNRKLQLFGFDVNRSVAAP